MIRLLRKGSFLLILPLLFLYTNINAQDSYTSGVIEFQNKNFKAAARTFEQYISQHPDEISAYQYLINAYINLKKFDKALKLLENNQLRFKDSKDFQLLLGKLYINSKQFDRAERILLNLNDKYSNDKNIKTLLARIYFNEGILSTDKNKFDKAAAYLKKSLSFDNNFPQTFALLGNVLMQADKLNESEKIFKRGLKKFPANDAILSNYSLILIKKKEFDKATKYLEKVWNRNQDNIQIGLQLATLYRVRYKINEAFAIYEKLLKKHPKEKAVYNEMIKYYTAVGDQENKRKVLEQMEKVFPEDEKITLAKIKTYVKEGKDSLAIYNYQMYLQTHKKAFNVYLQLSDLFRKQHNYENGISVLIEGNKYGLENEEYLLKLGNLYSENNNNVKAISEYKKMIEKYSGNFLPYFKIGNIFLQENILDSAEVYYNSALKTETDEPFVLIKIAELYTKRNSKNAAINYWEKAFKSNLHSLDAEQKMMISQLKSTGNLMGLMDKIDLSQKDRMEKYKLNIEKANGYLRNHLVESKYLSVINNLINDYPTSPILFYYKGIFYEGKKDYKTAEKLYSRVLSVSPKYIKAHKQIAELYTKMNQINRAIKSYKRVLSLDDKDRTAYKSLIKLYRKTGNLNELCNEWLKIHFTQPGNKVLREFLIVALHKANRKQEATKIIKESEKYE